MYSKDGYILVEVLLLDVAICEVIPFPKSLPY